MGNFRLECGFYDGGALGIRNTFHEGNTDAFDGNVFSVPDGTNFLGLFQNTKYFEGAEEIIKREFRLRQEIEDYAVKFISSIREKVGSGTEIVSLHVRRGDLTDASVNPDLAGYCGNGKDLDKDSIFGKYLESSKLFFEKSGKNVAYLVFTGGSRKGDENMSDMDWCKINISGDNIFYSENNSSIQDFAIMTMCDHNIIGHLTTFSWWAACLNSNPNKIVLSPDEWFLGSSNAGRKRVDFYPKEFIQI
jgi:hypothetical protein